MKDLTIRDFTLDKYAQLCEVILSRYVPLSVSDYLKRTGDRVGLAVMRHDVDRFATNALKMAMLEKKMGIRSTYYFRYPYTFNEKIIDKIAGMGHKIGYHYECLAKAKGDFEKAIEIFKNEMLIFRKAGYLVSTVAAHGGSLSHSNIDLLQCINLNGIRNLGGDVYGRIF